MICFCFVFLKIPTENVSFISDHVGRAGGARSVMVPSQDCRLEEAYRQFCDWLTGINNCKPNKDIFLSLRRPLLSFIPCDVTILFPMVTDIISSLPAQSYDLELGSLEEVGFLHSLHSDAVIQEIALLGDKRAIWISWVALFSKSFFYIFIMAAVQNWCLGLLLTTKRFLKCLIQTYTCVA